MWYLRSRAIRTVFPLMTKCLQDVRQKRMVWSKIQLRNRKPIIMTQTEESKKKITPMGWVLLLIPATTFGLGCWQLKRKAWKEALIKELETRTKIPPVPIPEDLSELDTMEYRKVKARGHYLHNRELVMGPRTFIRPDGVETSGSLFSNKSAGSGYLIITPFKLADRDDIILVNRGWVPRKQLKPIARQQGQIAGEVEIIGLVRLGEKRPQFSPEHSGDSFLYRDLPKMCSATGALPVFLDATFDPSQEGGPIGGQTRVNLRNDHLSYLITWYGLSISTAYLWYRQVLKGKAF